MLGDKKAPIILFSLVAFVATSPTVARIVGSDSSEKRALEKCKLPKALKEAKASKKAASSAFLDPIQKDVCIVGGGPAGVYAAYLLEEKSCNVALFEKADTLGGKTVPFVDDTEIVNCAPNAMVRHYLTSDMTLVQKMIDQFNLRPLEETALTQAIFVNEDISLRLDLSDALATYYTNPSLLPPALQQTLQALIKYIGLWTTIEAVGNNLTHPTHNHIPDELMVPVSKWLEENNLQPVAPILYNGFTNFGYGFIQEIPIIYFLKYISPTKIAEGDSTFFPMHLIFEAMGSELKDVNLSAEVDTIQVNDEGRWNLSWGEGNVEYSCEKVILAFPPTETALSIVQGIDATTKALFEENIHTVMYYEALISGLPSCDEAFDACLSGGYSYAKQPTPQDVLAPTYNIPNIYFRRTSNSKVSALFNAGDSDNGVDIGDEEVADIIRNHLNATFNYESDDYSIVIKKWPYFPHVRSESMMNGFYNNLAQVQGKQNLFFTGGFRDMELVDNAMRTTEDLLDSAFPSC